MEEPAGSKRREKTHMEDLAATDQKKEPEKDSTL